MLIRTLKEALNEIDWRFYGSLDHKRMLSRGANMDDDNPKQLPLAHALFKHNERVFCYELYRHWANRIEAEKRGGALAEAVILQCELPKEVIKDISRRFRGTRPLSGRFFPDFLVHEPGNFGNQELVMEVKADPALPFTDLIADLEKIAQFMERYLYKRGVFLAVNIKQENLIDVVRRAHTRERLLTLRDRPDIEILTRESARCDTLCMSLSQLVAAAI